VNNSPARVDASPASPFPVGGRRAIFYLIYDTRGHVDEYIPFKLAALREHADFIFVVVNGALTDEGRARLEPVADVVWERENVGFDVWGYKSALAHYGAENLAQFDEIILMNYTWFGPVRPFGPLFDRMNARPAHFWGMTDYGEETPNPFTKTGILHRHIQSHWIAVRRPMFQSAAWGEYWATMPMIRNYIDSILNHESRFTHHFESLGFASDVAYAEADYPSQHPALINADLLLADGCPVLKRRPFFHYPPYLDQKAVVGRWTLEAARRYGYPTDMIMTNLVKNSPPKTLYTDAQMLEVLPDVNVLYDESSPLRLAAVLHIFYEDMTDELMDRIAFLPTAADVFITTTDEHKARRIRHAIDARPDRERFGSVEVRILPSNRGRDVSAFFIACKDVLASGRYDVIVKIHSKKTVQESYNAGRYFQRHQIENTLNSPGYAANVLGLFQREAGLGMTFAPMIHFGYPTMGRGWYENRERTKEVASDLGIRVPFDDVSPLAPYGCMWFCRPEALRLMVEHEWQYKDYAAPDKHRDGSLAHVQERLVTYAAAELGYHVRTTMTAEHAAISHTALDFNFDQISATMPGYPLDQIQFLHRAGWLGYGGIVALTRVYLKLNHPRVARALRPLDRPARRLHHILWRIRHPRQWRRYVSERDDELG
jgi:lipopolysaccharide biosynthesis protein